MGSYAISFIWITVVLLAAYFAFVIWLGKKGSAHSGTLVGFTIAKGKVNPWIVGMSFGASFASANLFLGVPAWAYSYGVSTLWWTLGCFGISWIGLLVFSKTFWRYGQKNGGVVTLPEWLGKKYDSDTIRILVAFLILFNVYYIVGQNVGLATLFETIVGIPYIWGVVLGVTITILYVGWGGAFAQLVSDGVQGIIMCITSIIIFVSLLWTVGGGLGVFDRLHGQLASISPQLVAATSTSDGPFNSGFSILSIQWLLFSFVLLPHLLNKVLTLDDEKQLRPFTLSAGISLFLLSTLTVFAGLAARVILPNIEAPDKAIPLYLIEAFHPVIVAIILTGIISAILSTTDSLYLGISSSIGNDIFKPLVGPFLLKNKSVTVKMVDDRAVKISKSSLIVIGLLSLYLAVQRPDSLALLIQFGTSAIISGIAAPIALGYFWPKANKYGALASLIGGAGLYMTLTSLEIVSNLFIALFYSSILGFTLMISVCLVTQPAVKRKLKYSINH
ncbi:sodium:solute symporter family transporter [Pseudalkalibacillus sp. Hm43]|uniref:sodium:solute symporter family transporter n=1 Tax=Pseudalkalibacillus sp. Hm43 TaxID=3450742 RepID=UPI003F41EE6F